MFWKSAHHKYGHLTAEDEEIKKYLALSGEFQEGGYKGLVGYIQDIGHRWVASRTPPGPVLEIGFGSGRHRQFFSGKLEHYYVSEYTERYVRSGVWKEFCGRGVRCDARRLPYRSAVFQAVISIYNLEHIADLQSVLRKVHRVLRPGGKFLSALPCERGFLWNIGREITTRRAFQKQYGINYEKIIAYEHVWDLAGVLQQIKESCLFCIESQQMFPFRLPTPHLNLIACIECSAMNVNPA